MVKYNWTIDDLKLRLEELKRNYYKEKDLYKKQDIIYDIELLTNYIEEEYYEYANNNDLPLIAIYSQTKEIHIPYSYIMNDLKEFDNLTINKEIKTPYLRKNSLSNDDLMDLANDFFKYIGHPFYGNFQRIFRQRKKHIKFIPYNEESEVYGNTIFLRSKNEGFLTINRNNTIEDIASLIHEIEHNIVGFMNPNFICTHYCEIDVTLLEILFLDYYYHQTNDSDALYLKAQYFNSTIIASNEINTLNKLDAYEQVNGNFIKNKTLKYYANKLGSFNSKDFEYILKDYSNNKLLSLIGSIYAIELYYKFMEDFNLGKDY